MAGFPISTASALVNGVTPSGFVAVVTPVTSSLTFAPTAASPLKSPTMVNSFFPLSSALSRVKVYMPPFSVMVASRGVAPLYDTSLPLNSFKERGSTAFSFSVSLKLTVFRWSAFITPVVFTNSPARFTYERLCGVATTLLYCEPASVTLMSSSFTHFTFATQPLHALA